MFNRQKVYTSPIGEVNSFFCEVIPNRLKYIPIIRFSLHKKMKFSIKDFFSKCDQIRRKLWIWSHLLKKSLMKNFIFCAVFVGESGRELILCHFLQQNLIIGMYFYLFGTTSRKKVALINLFFNIVGRQA